MPRFIALVFIFIGFAYCLNAQICTGTLGENIFEDGDFGAGSSNLITSNPNIAPGYSYTTNVPPFDGQYVLTNNTGVWPGLFGGWLGITDNSSDPNGYMMVVNASFEPGLFYEQSIAGLCENTLYEFSADIINLIRVGVPDHHDPNVTFLLDGVEVFSTEDIPQTNEWTTYGFTFITNPNQTTLTLSLRNNAPGGVGNDLALDNITFRACGPETFVSPQTDRVFLCEDGPSLELEAMIIGNQYSNPAIQWQQSSDQGITWENIDGAVDNLFTPFASNSGLFFYRFLLADGISNLSSEKCRVVSNVILLNILPEETSQSETICEGLSFQVGNSDYTESGIFVDSLFNILGCDSIVTTNLNVVDDSSFSADILSTPPSCPGFTDGSISVQNISNGAPPFEFTFENENFGAIDFYPDLMSGESYSLSIEDDIGCVIDTVLFIEDPSDLLLELGNDLNIELGDKIILSPQVNFEPADINWQSTTPIICTSLDECIEFEFQALVSQQVSIALIAENGCLVSDSIFIVVEDVRKLGFPNAFSPNKDGINDAFTAFGDSDNVQFVEELLIFDRWGGLIFEAKNLPLNNLQNGWDGTFRDKDMPTGIYFYTASVRFIDEVVLRYSGDLFLAR